MLDLREHLRAHSGPHTGWVGLGQVGLSDDGLGVRLAEALLASGLAVGSAAAVPDRRRPRVLIAGTSLEGHLPQLRRAGFESMVFLDAVDLGAAPGSAVWLNAAEIVARFPQVSTHKLSLGFVARWIEAETASRCMLLGVQPATVRPGSELSPAVQSAVDSLAALITDGWRAAAIPRAGEPGAASAGTRARSVLAC